jgi:hypothetical protein
LIVPVIPICMQSTSGVAADVLDVCCANAKRHGFELSFRANEPHQP